MSVRKSQQINTKNVQPMSLVQQTHLQQWQTSYIWLRLSILIIPPISYGLFVVLRTVAERITNDIYAYLSLSGNWILWLAIHVYAFLFCILPLEFALRAKVAQPMNTVRLTTWATQFRLIHVLVLGILYLFTKNLFFIVAAIIFSITVFLFTIVLVITQIPKKKYSKHS